MRLIDADALLEKIDTEREILVKDGRLGTEHILVHYVREFIEDAPAVDAVEVVKDMFKGEMKLMPLEVFPRDQDKTCEFCYYQYFDERAYPCSRCVCNMPTENKFMPIKRAERE